MNWRCCLSGWQRLRRCSRSLNCELSLLPCGSTRGRPGAFRHGGLAFARGFRAGNTIQPWVKDLACLLPSHSRTLPKPLFFESLPSLKTSQTQPLYPQSTNPRNQTPSYPLPPFEISGTPPVFLGHIERERARNNRSLPFFLIYACQSSELYAWDKRVAALFM